MPCQAPGVKSQSLRQSRIRNTATLDLGQPVGRKGARPMKYWDASGIVPLLVKQARTQDMEQLLAVCLDQRLSDAGRKEGFPLAVNA